MNLENLKEIAREIRGRIISNSHKTKMPHLGSCLSCVDILVAVYLCSATFYNLLAPRVLLFRGISNYCLGVPKGRDKTQCSCLGPKMATQRARLYCVLYCKLHAGASRFRPWH